MIATIIPDFRGYVMAVERVDQLLHQVAAALDRDGVPYAVIGGNAVAAWVSGVDPGAVRATKDVDILLRRADLPSAAGALVREGLELAEVHGVTMFLSQAQPNPRTGVHVVFAGERVRPHETHAAPDVSGAVPGKTGFRVIGLRELVAMKLQAFRRIDQVHIEDLLAVGLIDDATVASLPADLGERLREIERTRRLLH